MDCCNYKKKLEEPQPYQEYNLKMSSLEYIKEFSNIDIISIDYNFEEIEIQISIDNLVQMVLFLKDDPNCMFEQLSDLTAIDYPERKKRFSIVYQFLSVKHNNRIRVLCSISENETVPSLAKIFPSSIWAEREIWDMFGIFVDDHPDLRRLLTDYGFQGHPLRKDFPLTGHVEVNYDNNSRRVQYNPVSLVQDFRQFDFSSPWGDNIDNETDKNN